MKNKAKFIKYFAAAMLSFVFLFSLTSCGSKSKYLKGSSCGSALEEGTVFNKVRKVYVERFVYEYNLYSLVEAETAAYHNCADLFEYKYDYDNGDFIRYSDTTSDEYLKAHYLFVYYGDYETQVVSYINNTLCSSDASLAASYNELVAGCYNGFPGSEKYGYDLKLNTKSADGKYFEYDADSPKVGNNTINSVKNRLTQHSKACIVFTPDYYDPDTGVAVSKTTWKESWNVGVLHGLFVFPMAWLINLFIVMFGQSHIYSGAVQIAAILIVTIVLKVAIFLLTFKSQSSTQKMQDIQPEILKVQSKYGQNPSPEEKQKMSMELMAVYQKYGVKPLAPFASLLITFPIFISMYRAVMYLGILRKGEIFGVILGNNLNSYIIGGGVPIAARITGIVIFILMAGSQILTMKLPQILNRKRMTEEAKKQQKQAGMMSNVMMIMILVMGFMMPVTMSIYWIASAVVGVAQSLIMHKLNNANKDGNGKYKVKKEEKPITIPQGYKK